MSVQATDPGFYLCFVAEGNLVDNRPVTHGQPGALAVGTGAPGGESHAIHPHPAKPQTNKQTKKISSSSVNFLIN